MITLLHERMYFPTYTVGSWYMPDRTLICKVLELPWLDNQHNISCIPGELTYLVRYNPPKEERPYGYYRFDNVHGRKNILAHRGDDIKDSKGCQLVGSRWADFDGNSIPDIAESTKKLQYMVETLPAEFFLKIIEKPKYNGANPGLNPS